MGGATDDGVPEKGQSGNFNPRSPWGERRGQGPRSRSPSYFNPRSPWGERPKNRVIEIECKKFQSTLPVGGATVNARVVANSFGISIHAPRGGSDSLTWPLFSGLTNFNPRSPWGERRRLMLCPAQTSQFQSTLPVGGATVPILIGTHQGEDFNPRSPWGERLRTCGADP